MANKGFIRSVITDMMRKRGIDESFYDEAYVDETLTTRENIANLRDKVYHLDEDLTESQHSQMKEYTQQEEWAKAQKQPEEDDRLDTIGFGRMSMFKSKASEGWRGKYASKASRKKGDTSFYVSAKGKLKAPKKPDIARYIPKPIQVARENAVRSAMGIPPGFNFNPVTVFRKQNSPTIRDPLFGNVKVDKKGRRRLF